jgi:ribonuclease D
VQPIIEAIKRGRAVPETDLPQAIVVQEADPAAQVVVDLVLSIVRARAQTIGIAPSYFTSPEDIRRRVVSFGEGTTRPDVPILRGWRYEHLGRLVEGLLSGALALGVGNGTVELFERTTS